ncbi:hypothetical protein PG999_003258 [Apiospora kogelbergensis]|uniref:Uncharacterized protein n=1 Tax=Apiospora kogelbergensis TaxID=1337665 RepID=A0AAW0R359_9PEZI
MYCFLTAGAAEDDDDSAAAKEGADDNGGFRNSSLGKGPPFASPGHAVGSRRTRGVPDAEGMAGSGRLAVL